VVADSKVLARILDFYDTDLLRLITGAILRQIIAQPPVTRLALLTLLAQKVPDVLDEVNDSFDGDDELKCGCFRLCIRAEKCGSWGDIAEFGLSDFRAFGAPLAHAAIEEGVVAVLPRLINVAVHLFVGGATEVTALLMEFAAKYGTVEDIARALVGPIIAAIPTHSDVRGCIAVINAVNRVSPGALRFVWENLEQRAKKTIVAVLSERR
jgi:hypothetical protein